MKVSVAPLMMHIVTPLGGGKPNHWESIIFNCSNSNTLLFIDCAAYTKSNRSERRGGCNLDRTTGGKGTDLHQWSDEHCFGCWPISLRDWSEADSELTSYRHCGPQDTRW
ncbi:hypothetical protein PS15p_205280 [Mucor circinelloides]